MELNTYEAAAVIGIGQVSIIRHVKEGRLEARRIGYRGVIRVSVDALRAFAAKYNYDVNEELLRQLAARE
jgi:hypothetical protein